MELRQADQHVSFLQQLDHDSAEPVVLINQFTVPADDVDHFLDVWADDARYMKQQPGFMSTQLHRGIAGSTTFVNTADWESAATLRAAFTSPEFQQRMAQYPAGVTASPHVYRKQAVPGVCTA